MMDPLLETCLELKTTTTDQVLATTIITMLAAEEAMHKFTLTLMQMWTMQRRCEWRALYTTAISMPRKGAEQEEEEDWIWTILRVEEEEEVAEEEEEEEMIC